LLQSKIVGVGAVLATIVLALFRFQHGHMKCDIAYSPAASNSINPTMRIFSAASIALVVRRGDGDCHVADAVSDHYVLAERIESPFSRADFEISICHPDPSFEHAISRSLSASWSPRYSGSDRLGYS
jgi:hypothetical protein